MRTTFVIKIANISYKDIEFYMKLNYIEAQ